MDTTAQKTINYLNSQPPEIMEWSMGDLCYKRLVEFLRIAYPERAALKGLRILEIGTCRGMSAAVLACFGRVMTLDIVQYPETAGIMAGLDKEVRDNITFVVCPNPLYFIQTLTNAVYDVVLIDAAHDYASCQGDTAFAMSVSPVVIWHDFHAEKFPGVYRAVEEVVGEHKPDHFYHSPNCSLAMGIWQ